MPGVTKEQIARAKEWDLLSYLQAREPQELKRCGAGEFCLRSHGSLKISNGKWHWHSRGIGGRSALDYLVKVQGMDFVSAVKRLCGDNVAEMVRMPQGEPEQKKAFVLPEKNPYASNVISYLQRRGIDADIIRQCMEEEILYESRKRHNCVFVGRDTGGKARYAFLRGTGEVYKQDVAGSDKRYGFCLPAADPQSPYLAVTESPIDALAVASLVKRRGGDYQRAHYLSLGGTTPRALLRFLKDHPQIKYLSLCLDNDAAGQKGMERIQAAIMEDRELNDQIRAVVENPPHESSGCKDYAQLLQGMKEKRERKREYGIAI